MKNLTRVSRWITIKHLYNVSKRNSLYDYAVDDNGYGVHSDNFSPENGVFLDYFRWNGKTYAIGQFLSRFGICGFDKECKEYPGFICGYDGNNYFNPLYCELSEDGEQIRLYKDTATETKAKLNRAFF